MIALEDRLPQEFPVLSAECAEVNGDTRVPFNYESSDGGQPVADRVSKGNRAPDEQKRTNKAGHGEEIAMERYTDRTRTAENAH